MTRALAELHAFRIVNFTNLEIMELTKIKFAKLSDVSNFVRVPDSSVS